MTRLAFAPALALALALAAACGPPTQPAAPCTGDQDCAVRAGGRCLASPLGSDQCAYPSADCASGYSWSDLTGSIAGTCVADADAGVDAVDAPIDAMDAPIDAPDGGPTGPIVDDYQLADLVIGQPSFTMESARGFTGQSVHGGGVSATAAGVWVVDEEHARVLGFLPTPATGDPVASNIVGRPSVTDSATIGAATASNLGFSSGSVAAGGGMLVVADKERNRVLIWNPAPTAPGEAADVVLGQADMTATGAGNGASQLHFPSAVWTDGTRLIVGERLNYRVLIWNSIPTTNGQAANVVLGQSGFGVNVTPSTATASNMTAPAAIYFDGSRLYVADAVLNRVMVWSGLPTANNAPASFVLGQQTLTESADVAASPTTLNQPTGIAVYGNALLVADRSNDRVCVYQPIPTSTGSAASLVLGVPNLTTTATGPRPPTQRDLDDPAGLAVVGNQLYVADDGNRRVVRFTLHN